MNVNMLRTTLTNIEMSLKEVKDRITFGNSEVSFQDQPIEYVIYENGCLKLGGLWSQEGD